MLCQNSKATAATILYPGLFSCQRKSLLVPLPQCQASYWDFGAGPQGHGTWFSGTTGTMQPLLESCGLPTLCRHEREPRSPPLFLLQHPAEGTAVCQSSHLGHPAQYTTCRLLPCQPPESSRKTPARTCQVSPATHSSMRDSNTLLFERQNVGWLVVQR